ncbi:hypothetical protein [Nocardia sp. BMG51109]|uniref:hypothetical protein n=1 Tax=Nocardia sp. BMG51109 TaxID=1056816 RepID=UPI00046685BD|nr:hypothetical protein [Nocardia sp. BMG51109]
MTIEGRVERATTDSPTVTFRNEAGELLAVAARGPGVRAGGRPADPLGARGRGRYRIDYPDGSAVWVESRRSESVVRRGDGTVVATLLRAGTVTAVAATGGTLFHFVPDPGAPRTTDPARLLLLDRMGGEIGCLAVCLADADAGISVRPSRIAIRGIRLSVAYTPDRTERDVLFGACVDLAADPRPYAPGGSDGI